MALTFVKFTCFKTDIGLEKHNLNTDTIKVALTNTAPAASDTVFAPGGAHPPPAAANGYTSGGHDITNAWSAGKLTGTDVTITATAGGIGPFRYIILYNDDAPADEVIAYYDYGSSVTLANAGDNIVIDFDATNGILTNT